jgi:hypothetical protein
MGNSMPIINPDNKELQQFLRGKVSTMQAKEAEDAHMRELLKPYIVPEEPSTDDDDDTTVPAVAPLIGNTSDVAYQIRQINQCLEDAAAFKNQASEAMEFYQRRVKALEERADFLKENVGRWLKMNGMQKLATHSGTIFFSKRTKVTLPEDEVLLTWAIDEDPVNEMGLYKTVVNKTDVKNYIKSSGHTPEGYMEEKVEGISIRKVA